MVGTTVTLPEATPRSSSRETAQPGLTLPNAQPSAELSQQLLATTSQNPQVILTQTSPGDAQLPGSPLDPGALEVPPSNEKPPVVSPGETPSLIPPDTSATPSNAATPQQFQFTLQQIQTLDRVRTMLGNGNYGQSLDSVRLQMVTRTNYTQAEINGLGNSLHAMVSGMLIAADQQAQRIDEYTPAGGARFTVDQLHAGGIGAIRQALRNANIPTEPMYVGIRRSQDVAAASTSTTAAPISSTVNPNATSTTPVVADPNSLPQVVTTPSLTTTRADERSQATPALQVVPSNIGTTEEENVTNGTVETQPLAPAIPRPDAVFAEYRRRQRLEGEVA